MLNIKISIAASFVLAAVFFAEVTAQVSHPPGPNIPSMSSDDMAKPQSQTSTPKPSTNTKAPVAVWENMPKLLAQAMSFRASLHANVVGRRTDTLYEVVEPDRTHITMSVEGHNLEMVAIGSTGYKKVDGGAWIRADEVNIGTQWIKGSLWSVFEGTQSVTVLEPDTIDGVAMDVFDIVVVVKLSGKRMKERVWAGESDGLPRKIQSVDETGQMEMTFLFYDYNRVSIQAPQL